MSLESPQRGFAGAGHYPFSALESQGPPVHRVRPVRRAFGALSDSSLGGCAKEGGSPVTLPPCLPAGARRLRGGGRAGGRGGRLRPSFSPRTIGAPRLEPPGPSRRPTPSSTAFSSLTRKRARRLRRPDPGPPTVARGVRREAGAFRLEENDQPVLTGSATDAPPALPARTRVHPERKGTSSQGARPLDDGSRPGLSTERLLCLV